MFIQIFFNAYFYFCNYLFIILFSFLSFVKNFLLLHTHTYTHVLTLILFFIVFFFILILFLYLLPLPPPLSHPLISFSCLSLLFLLFFPFLFVLLSFLFWKRYRYPPLCLNCRSRDSRPRRARLRGLPPATILPTQQ